ncbi:MAG: gliding motility-associated C-terminal domain-containing protein [Saprospirales bacterium]|nr:gliding motility-associated C-terminal domain-containing protein [Saprospirales bacterium]
MSADCAPGLMPCTLCPGDSFELNAAGTGLLPGTCINWFYGTSNSFNPYIGEGTYLGCSEVVSAPPNPCNACPSTLAILVDACGTEQNNEFMTIWSGSGFFVNDATLDFDAANNGPNPNDADVGGGCGWQEPGATVLAHIQTTCPNATVVGAGPGESVPSGVPVLVFTSAGTNFNYNLAGLCALSPVIYVMQNGCARTIGAFSNSASAGLRTTVFGLTCGCSWSTTYDCGLLVGGDGAYVTDAGLPVTYGNSGCDFPPAPGGGGMVAPFQITPLTVDVTTGMCNNGPYWVAGIADSLPGGCNQAFTNYLPFEVTCTIPVLDSADICHNGGLFDLTQLQDPLVPNGLWSGPGVNGNTFNPAGLFGTHQLTFTPSGGCGIPVSTLVKVFPAPIATFNLPDPVCPGTATDLVVQLTGQAPWIFDLLENGVFLNSYSTAESPVVIQIAPTAPATYTISNFSDKLCPGPDAEVSVSVTPVPSGTLTIAGPDTICSGNRDTLAIDFTDGMAPFTFVYSINGVLQAPVTTSNDPFIFLTPVLTPGMKVIRLDSLSANGCKGAGIGTDTILALSSPTAQLISDTVAICAGQTDTLRIKFTGPAPYTFQYIAGNDTLPAVTSSDTFFLLPVAPPLGFTNYSLLTVTAGGCTGPVSGLYGIHVSTPPSATLSGDTTICFGSPAPLTVNFTGAPPFVIQYTANGAPQSPDTMLLNPQVLTVAPAVPTLYTLTGVSAGGCAGTATGQAVVNVLPALSAVISGGGQICQGGSGTTLAITFQGPGPYTFVYQAGVINQAPITTSQNPYIIPVNPPNGTVYRLVSLSNGICQGAVSGTAVVAVFTPSTASLSGDLTFCNSADTALMVDFTGSGPFSLVYAVNNVAQPVVETFDDPYFIPVQITSTTTYNLISVESPGCVGMVNGQATVTVNYPPSYANLVFNCNLAAGVYTVGFDVLNAATPLTLLTGAGAFGGPGGTHFTSAPIPIAQGYQIAFHDANDCGDISLSGQSGCNCTTGAGTMNLAPVSACIGSAATAIHNGDQFLDNNDNLRFILHTNPAAPAGQILAWNTTPVFSFGPGLLPNTTYYISAIAGNPDPNGNIDLNDPCMTIAQGTPVVFYALPSATLDSIPPACPGNGVLAPVILGGTPPFALNYAVNGIVQAPILNIATTTVDLNILVSDPTTLTILSVSDAHCTSLNTDTLALSVIQAPQVSNLTVSCNFVNNTYTLEFDVAGQAPFAVSGVTGFFTGAHFTSLPVPTNQPYALSVADANLCGQALVSGMANCVCATGSGDMDPAPLEGCTATPLVATHLGNALLEPGDVLQFVLHSNSGTVLGAVLAVQDQPVFAFLPGTMIPGITYYISAIAGNDDGAGAVDLSDPCLSVSPGTPVLWHQTPTASADANFDICSGESVLIPVTLAGQAPFQLTYTTNGLPNTVAAVQNTYTISATLVASTTFALVSVSNAQCPGVASGQAVATVHPAPQITGTNVICAPDNLSYTIEFDVLNADPATAGVSGSVTGNLNPATGHFVSDPIIPPTGYSAVVADSWQCGADSISGGANCSCVTNAGSMEQTNFMLCLPDTIAVSPATGAFLAPGDTLLYALTTTASASTWSILVVKSVPVFQFDPNTMTPGATYYIVALASNAMPGGGIDLNDPCRSFAVGAEVVWQPQPVVFLGTDATICQGDTAMLVLLFNGTPPFEIVYQTNGINQPVINTPDAQVLLPVSPAATSTYNLLSAVGGGCPAALTGAAVVTVNAAPQILNAVTVCDLTTQSYTLQFAVSNGPAPNPVYTVNGLAGSFTDTTFLSAPVPGGQGYNITVVTPDGCAAALSGSIPCMCVTDAGTMGAPGETLDVCLPGDAVAQPSGNANLEGNDVLQYILCQNPALLPQGVLASNNNPQFAFQPGMQPDTTYFIVAIAGNTDANGAVDWSDPCLSVSPPLAVVFHNPPTATLAGDTSICRGGSATFKINFTGTAPFPFVYTINGNPQSAVSAPQNSFTFTTNNVQQGQTYALVSVHDLFCPGTASGDYRVHIIPAPSASLSPDQTICPGDSAQLALTLQGAALFDVTINGGLTPVQLSGVQNGAVFSVSPAASTTYTIGAFNAQGNACPPDIGSAATVTLSPEISTSANLSDYGGGFNVSCPNEADGSVSLIPAGGIPPLTAIWDNGASGLSVANLGAGDYVVTLTDQIGCVFTDTFLLVAPEGLQAQLQVRAPVCFGERNARVTVMDILGGLGPFVLTLSGQPAQISDVFPVEFSNLAAGAYNLSIMDANGCETSIPVDIPPPDALAVDLGPDITLYAGDSILLAPVLSGGGILEAFTWSPVDGLSTPDALNTYAKPLHTMAYHITVVDTASCEASDIIRITIRKDRRVYIPTVIKPGTNGDNGTLTVYAGPEVVRIRTLRIYDRWGDCVFEQADIEPNQPAQGWPGRWRGRDVPPGVYAYMVELEYIDGEKETRSGDVTVIR